MPTGKQRRNTPQRKVILEELCAVHSHPTAAELYEIVRRRLPRISLGTVYRNLEVLYEDGQIDKLELAGAETRFDGNLEPHCHARCTACGKVTDLYGIEKVLPPQPAEIDGHLIEGYRLEFFGHCTDCRMRESYLEHAAARSN